MKTSALLLMSSMVFVFYSAIGANGPSSTFASDFLHPKNWAFEENMGQLSDPGGNALKEIKFFGNFAGVQVYCTSQKLSFVFTKKTQGLSCNGSETKPPVKLALPVQSIISASRLDLEFEGSNPDVTILSGDKQAMEVNYASSHNGVYGVQFYKTLTYKNLYDHIDMVVAANEKGLEYEFVVHPGGNVNNIKLVRNGADAMEALTDGGIKYSTAFGILQESKPQSFSESRAIGSNFMRNGNKLSFKTEEYDHKKDLVIDPGLTWSSYFGSDSDDESKSIVLDGSGNVYISGITNSPVGMATKGAYQTSLAGGVNYDAFVAKFSGAGKLIWATYYGGSAIDYETGCAIDSFGNLFISGTTLSKTGIATKGAYQTSLNGSSYNSFLAKFSNNGVLTWATYFGGGTADVQAYKVTADAKGNAYLVGYTGSHSGVATKGSFQTAFGGGNYDAFIAKFSGNGGLDWATYFGGGGDDYGLGIGIDDSSNIYITGSTKSAKGIATSGAYKSIVDANAGNAFLAAFDSSGMQKWGTYFGGNGGSDVGYALATNHKDKVYITGYTANTSGVATNGSYQTYFYGTSDVFLADFNTSGSINWSTYYGGGGDQTAFGISDDTLGNIYITGYTTSASRIATTGAFLTSLTASAPYPNAFLAKFSSNGILKYGTYYGGSIYDQGESVANDNAGDVFITGLTASSGIATAGVYQTAFKGGPPTSPFDAFVAKFLLCNLSTSLSGSTTACVNSTTSYKASSHANSTYVWTVTGGTILSGKGTDSVTVQWNSAGSGTVSEEEVNSLTGCTDNASLKVNVGSVTAPVITGDTLVCPLGFASYHVSPAAGVTYSWKVTTGNITTLPGRDSIEVLWPSIPGKGTVSIKESLAGGVCPTGDTINVTIEPNPVPHVKIVDNGKGSYKFTSLDSSWASSGYSWVINGAGYSGYHVGKTFHHDSSYHFSLTVTNSAGCTKKLDSTVNVGDAGISENNRGSLNFSIFPNPFKDLAEIHYSVSEPGYVEITVSDMLGRNIATLQNKNLQPGNYMSTLDPKVFHLTEGIYFVTMRANGNTETQKIIRVKN